LYRTYIAGPLEQSENEVKHCQGNFLAKPKIYICTVIAVSQSEIVMKHCFGNFQFPPQTRVETSISVRKSI